MGFAALLIISRAALVVAFSLIQIVAANPVHGGMPIVSPDGKHISFWGNRGEGDQLFVIDADGTHEVQLTHGKRDYGRTAWTADGRRVVINDVLNDTGPSSIFEVPRTGGAERAIGKISGRNPVLLHDGRVLFVSGGWRGSALSVASRDGSGERRISGGTAPTWNPMLSPNGHEIAYTRADTGVSMGVWVMNVDGTNDHQLTHLTRAEGRAQVPAWSPDGKRIAFQAAVRSDRDSTKSVGHIWIVDVASGRTVKIAPHDDPYLDETPYWFPDGRRIAFQSDRSGRMEIWAMNADGTRPAQVTRASNSSDQIPAALAGRAAHAASPGAAARREDLAAFTREFFDVDRSYSPTARAEAQRRLNALPARIDAMSDVQFVLALAQIAALADNGHSSMHYRGSVAGMGRAGIRLAHFGADFIVVNATDANAGLLGGRLVSVDGHSIDELRDSARTLTGGTPQFRDEAAPRFLESPGQLHALGLSRAVERATYRVRMRDGREREAVLAVAPPPQAGGDFQAGGALEPIDGNGWRPLLARDKAPWSLRDPDALMRRRDAPEMNAIVIQLRVNMNRGQSIAAFLDASDAARRGAGRKNVVLDMRMNGGGDLTTTHAWMSGISARIAPDGRIVVLTGPATFSAAISSTGYVKQAGGARVTLVGEPPGDRLRFWAEGQGMTLPNSGAFVGTATQRHDYMTGCKGFSDCHAYMVRNPIAVKNLDPDISAPWTLEAYASGRDPGMEAAEKILHK